MKILEIIQPKIKDIDLRTKFTDYHRSSVSDEEGMFSVGRSDNKDPHLYNKTAKNLSGYRGDPFWYYAKNYCIKYQDTNPFFPRIYSYKTFYDNSGNAIPRIKTEKLNPFHEGDPKSEHILNIILNNLFDRDYLEKIHQENSTLDFETMFDMIVYVIRTKHYKQINNEKFIEFIELLHKCKLELSNSSFFDFHYGNFMYRLTPNGPQLVVNDPLGGW